MSHPLHGAGPGSSRAARLASRPKTAGGRTSSAAGPAKLKTVLGPANPKAVLAIYTFLASYCWYCGETSRYGELVTEHPIPRSRGGGEGQQTVTACGYCNASKSSRTVEEWREHIAYRLQIPVYRVVFFGETDAYIAKLQELADAV